MVFVIPYLKPLIADTAKNYQPIASCQDMVKRSSVAQLVSVLETMLADLPGQAFDSSFRREVCRIGAAQVVPLYGVRAPGIIYQHIADNVSGIFDARELKLIAKAIEDQALSPAA